MEASAQFKLFLSFSSASDMVVQSVFVQWLSII